MLKQLLALIGQNELRTQSALADALAVPLPLVAQMVEQLARSGYLVASQTCAEGCGECPLKSMCGPQHIGSLRFWALTDKGRAFVAGTGSF